MPHFVYLLQCADGTLYTGYATNLEKRLGEHNQVAKPSKGAKYTRGRQPVKIIYSEEHSSRSLAQQREAAIKKLKREDKLKLAGLTRA